MDINYNKSTGVWQPECQSAHTILLHTTKKQQRMNEKQQQTNKQKTC